MKPNLISICFPLAVVTSLVVSAASIHAQDVNVTGSLTYVAGTGGVFDYTLTLSNAGPEAIESLWLGWIPGLFDIAQPTITGNTPGWSSVLDGDSIQYGGTSGTALASGASATFTFESTSTPAQFQSGTAGPSTVYGVNDISQLSLSLSPQDTQVFTPTVVSSSVPISTAKENLTVTINPPRSGTVSPNLNGKTLIVAHSYTVTAVAAKGQVFANWSGILQSDDRSLTFVMPDVSNATLTANFIPSPFASNEVAGAYTGLFWDTKNLSNTTSGYFSATVANNGVISGQVKIAGVTAAFSTTLQADGRTSLELKRHNLSTLVLTLQVDLTGLQTLTGTVADTGSTFNALLTAYRAGSSTSQTAANYEGYYTWIMTGGSGNTPAGFSYGTARITAAGAVHLSIFLSDGTTTAAAGSLSANGLMPLYVSLAGGKDSLLSWLSFTNSSLILSTNGAYWFKGPVPVPSPPSSPYNPYRVQELVAKNAYNGGFTLTNLTLLMGAYTAEPKGTDALNASSVSVQLSGADLSSSISNVITLSTSGVGGSNTSATVNISDKTGLFSGSFKDPISGKMVHFNGAVLHPAAAGYGFFISSDLSGTVVLDP
jgi:hypothetical protein